MRLHRPFVLLLLAASAFVLSGGQPVGAAPNEIVGAARVYGDGSLRIGTKTVRLYGIYIPPTRRVCDVLVRPSRCGSRASVALDLKIQGFVRCFPVEEYIDGSLGAVCYVRRTIRSRGDDLSGFLLTQGLALAAPRAPFEYVALERIARARGLGLWGFSADSITFR